MEGSGIDQAWVEDGLYSRTTVSQILNGRHMYQSREAHTKTLIALYSMYYQSILVTEPDERVHFLESSVRLREAYEKQTGSITRVAGTPEKDL